jgi:hypothetical protein
MKKQIKIEVPTNWDSITLQTYLNLQKDLETYSDNEEAQTASMFHHICGLDPTWVNKLSLTSYNTLKDKLNGLVKPENVDLVRFVTIDGIQYGFEPNLSNMSYGAYSDISSLETLEINKNWAKVMNILYRPVVGKMGELYQIEPYKPNDEWEKWLGVSMEVHFGTWFFFTHLLKDLLKSILNFSKEMGLPPNIKSTLAKNGDLIRRLLN